MKSEYEDIKNDVERLADGRERKALLETLAELNQLDRDAARLEKETLSNVLGSTAIDRIFSALCFSGIGFFLAFGIYHARFPNFFVKRMPYVYWADEPYIFSFIVAFLTIAALVFLGFALGITRIGKGPTSRSSRSPRKRGSG